MQHGWEARLQGLGLGLTVAIRPKVRLIAALGPILISYGRNKHDD